MTDADSRTAPVSNAPGKPLRILLTGASGQVGTEFRALAAQNRFELLACDRTRLDITSPDAVTATVAAFRPHWIVNAAAYTAVDQAESEPEAAYSVNRDGPAHLAQAARGVGARMLQISTDYVFDGSLGRPYPPEFPTSPLGTYGRSKNAGDREVMDQLGDAALVIRTSWVYAHHGRNFFRTMLRLMAERDEIRVVEDQVGSPTSAASLARVIAMAIRQDVSGIHHWTDAGVASWYDFALAIREEGMRAGLNTAGCQVLPIPTREYPTPAARPPCSLLDKSSLRNLLSFPGHPWREELAAVVRTVPEAKA